MTYSYGEKRSKDFQTTSANRSIEVELDSDNHEEISQFNSMCESLKADVQLELSVEIDRLSKLNGTPE